MPTTAVLDACVIYRAQLRDLLMTLAVEGVFLARWTDAIHDEWTRNLVRDRPDITPAQVGRIRTLMDENVLDCLVTGYEGRIATLTLPDPNDRHVFAAAIHAKASVIITYNLDDFPIPTLLEYAIMPEHPDAFLASLFDLDGQRVVEIVGKLRRGLRKPPVSAEDYLATLERQSLPRTADRLHQFIDQI
jgi:hypothetical protein